MRVRVDLRVRRGHVRVRLGRCVQGRVLIRKAVVCIVALVAMRVVPDKCVRVEVAFVCLGRHVVERCVSIHKPVRRIAARVAMRVVLDKRVRAELVRVARGR
jgi:hypothetical protein